MFLKLLLVEEKTINLKASQILIVAVASHLKEGKYFLFTSLLLTKRQIDNLAQLRLAESSSPF